MKRYLIVIKSVATENNHNFSGKTNWYIKGKGGAFLSDVFRASELNEDSYKSLPTYCVCNYAYTTKAAACRGLKAQKEQDEFENSLGWWLSKSHVVEVEV